MRASAGDRLVAVLAPGQVREVHLRVRHVAGDLDVRHRHLSHARILDLVAQQIRELVLDLLGDALGALPPRFIAAGPYRVRDTSTIS